jgi:hypothetical protein
MPDLTYSNNLTNGNANDASQVMANFNNVKTLVNDTLLDQDNIKYFYTDVFFTFTADSVEEDKTVVYYLKPKVSNGDLEPQRVGLIFDSQLTGTAVTATLDVQRDAGSGFATILSSTISESSADTFETTDSFIGSPNISNDYGLKFILTTNNPAGSGNGIANVTVWLQCKAKHRQ